MTLAYRVVIGRQIASSRRAESDLALLELGVRLDMLGAGGCCELRLAQTAAVPAAVGDSLVVELDVGGGMERVFSGRVEQLEADTTGCSIVGYDGLRGLAAMELEGAYEGARADQVIRDLLQKGGLPIGHVASGPPLARLRLRRPPSLLAHVHRLASWYGADLHTDGAGRVQVTTAKEVRQSHRLQYREDLLRMDLRRRAPGFDALVVLGEGAAGSQGAGKEHWLPKDLSGVRGQAAINAAGQVLTGQGGKRLRRRQIGALGTAAAAGAVAAARMGAVAARCWQGELEIRGNPALLPGDQVTLQQVPEDHALSGALRDHPRLRVRGVRHRLSREGALITRLEF